MKTVSLHTRLLLATLVPVTLFVTIYGVLTVLFRFQDIDDLQTRNAELLVEKYRLEVMGTPDPGQWQKLLQVALENRYVRSVSIVDGKLHSMAHAGPMLQVPMNNLPKDMSLRTAVSALSEQYLQALSPFTHNGRTYWIALELRPSPFVIARYQSVIITTLTAFIFLFVLALLLASSLRRWLEPIAHMSRQISRLTPESLDQRLACKAEGDLAELQDDINSLLSKVEHSVAELRQDIEQTSADLEENYQTIEAQNIELRLSRAQAIEGNRIKSAFLANISHELRTPLNSINGFSRLLLKSQLQPRQADFVETIQKSANNLLAIINDVLDFSKIEAGKLQLEKQPFSIEDAVFDVLNMLSPQADDKGLEQLAYIYEDVPPMVEGDALRLKQVLTNLVSNAIKFTSQGEVVVRVMLEDSRPLHHVIRISVSDTGIGLSRTAKADLFQAFQQGDPSVSRQFGGTGLGLVIAKNLVELMEGQIGFDESQEKGSTFWFEFKAAVVEEKPSLRPSLKHKQVVVLESHEKTAQLIGSALGHADASVSLVPDWEDALLALAEKGDALIIGGRAASGLPEGQLQRVRDVFDGPIIVLTRGYDSRLESDNINISRLYSLPKPLRPRQLIALLAQSLSLARLQSPVVARPSVPDQVRSVPLRILAVDDHPANLKLVCTLLQDMGIETVAADSGIAAVELARERHFDLIFMDIQMPGMSGIDATRAIRLNEAGGRKVPIVALTAHALADEKELMLREGMNDYLTKPLQEEQLVHIIQRWTGVEIQETVWPSVSAGGPETALVNWSECLQLAAGKPDLARDMLNMLLDNLDVQREKMESAWRLGNFPALLAHTHYLHGATRYCGVPSLRKAAGELEGSLKAALKQAPDNARDKISGSYESLLRVMTDLQAWQQQENLPV
ncbi:MAG TPA: response regulator [Fluviicoccus sp.]|nr:response regulator [Fluviicoccus sp.]